MEYTNRFFLQTSTLSLCSDLNDEQYKIMDNIIKNIEYNNAIVTETLHELGYTKSVTEGDTVLWRIRQALVKNIPINNNNIWEFKYNSYKLELINRPKDPTNYTEIIVPSITIKSLKCDFMTTLNMLGINTVSFVYYKSDGSKLYIKNNVNIGERKSNMYTTNTNFTDLEKTIIAIAVFIAIYGILTVKKRK